MDARDQALQQAERDLKGQFEAKLLEAEQRNTQAVQQNQSLTQQVQALQEQLRQLTQEQQSRSTFGAPSTGISGGGGGVGAASGGQSAFSFMNASGAPTLGGGGGGLRGGGGRIAGGGGIRGGGQKPVVLSAFPNSSAPPASPQTRAGGSVPEGTPPGGGTQWAAHTRQQRGQQPIYRPQTDVPNHQVKTQVAKQGFLIKSSGGKKDSVGTAMRVFWAQRLRLTYC
jgi:hypothetical protein